MKFTVVRIPVQIPLKERDYTRLIYWGLFLSGQH